MGSYLGFVTLENDVYLQSLVRNSSGAPANADSSPLYRVYGPSGLMQNGTGSLAQQDTGAITNATNATPIVVTSPNHGLNTGVELTTANVVGNTAANCTTTVTVIDANTFSLDGTSGNGAYVSGGTWNSSGVYFANIAVNAANNYVAGLTYTILVEASVSGTVQADNYTFTVT